LAPIRSGDRDRAGSAFWHPSSFFSRSGESERVTGLERAGARPTMTDPRRNLAAGYAAICSVLFVGGVSVRIVFGQGAFLPVFFFIESLPTPILLASWILAWIIAWRVRRDGGPSGPWIAYGAAMFLFLMEETGWGSESMFLLTIRNRLPDGFSDIHNAIELNVLRPMYQALSPLELTLIALGVVIASVAVRRTLPSERLHRAFNRLLEAEAFRFIFVGVIWYAFGQCIDALEGMGISNVSTAWVTEEFAEVLGSIAFLFAAISRLRHLGNTVE
jgi:hypothetical protein